MWTVIQGARRYSELQRALPRATPKVLTQTLRGLERDGLINRRVVPGGRRHVEYSPTALGAAFGPVLEAMNAWGTWYRAERRATPATLHPPDDQPRQAFGGQGRDHPR
ncbi:MAG: helix-turn-helix transcriptional regulator [Gemmatimonadota bacterium]|nr:helix-turn-helix transcriptional regulator [Gemmatimonadota bacterium]